MKKSRGLSLGLVLGGENEIRTRGRDRSLRRFSKPVVSATHPSLLMTAFVLHIAATLSCLPARHVRPAACGKTSVAGLWVQSYECFPVPPNFTPCFSSAPSFSGFSCGGSVPPKGGKGRPAVFFRGLQGRKNLADWQIRLNFVPYNRIWHGTLQKKDSVWQAPRHPVRTRTPFNFRSDISCSKS